MTPSAIHLRRIIALVVVFLVTPIALAGDKPTDWKPGKAAEYLDGREKTWLEFAGAKRGQGTGQTTCVSCHSVLPYVLARPVLRRLTKTATPTEHEESLLA